MKKSKDVIHRIKQAISSFIIRLAWKGGTSKAWYVQLTLIGIILGLTNMYAFYPGSMSNDSIDQLLQTLGSKPVDDWHPPAMVLLWKITMQLSGDIIGSLLTLQISVLWLCLSGFAAYIYQASHSRILSLSPLFLGCAPFVLNISGVIWKDVQMAFALAAAFVIILIARKLKRGWRIFALVMIGLFMIYAASLRYNSWLAILPFGWLLFTIPTKNRWKYGLIAVFILLAMTVQPIITRVLQVKQTHPSSSIMIDDVIRIHDEQELRELSIDPGFKSTLMSIRQRCDLSKVPTSLMIGCANEAERTVLKSIYYENLRMLWLNGIARQFNQYAGSRINIFATGFLQPNTPWEASIWQGSETQNIASTAISKYVQFIAFDYGFLFRPYFWLIAGIGLAITAVKKRKNWEHAGTTLVAALSGVLYILSYIPLVIAYDYRYIYWAPLAICLGGILALVDHVNVRKITQKPHAN